MCFIDPYWSNVELHLSRRQFLGAGLAAGLTTTIVDWGKSLLLPGLAEGAEVSPENGGPGVSGVNFTWFGTDGWEITFGNKTILFDPWLSRLETGIFAGQFDPSTPLRVEEALIDQHIKKADQILIGHGHWDHMADVPYVAKKTGAMVIGSETHANVLRAFGVAEKQIVQVKGGEYFQFDGYTIEVFPGLHSVGPTKQVGLPGHLLHVPATPSTIKDLPEGDSLIYMITIRDQFSIFLMSTANFIERALPGLKPDVALIASISANQIHNYTPRLLKALHYPKVILPTHWDNFEKPYSEPPQDLRAIMGDAGNLDVWVKEAKQVSPQSKIVVLKYFESFAP